MSILSSRRQFTLRQLLACLAAACVVLAFMAPYLRLMAGGKGSLNDLLSLLVGTSGSAVLLAVLLIGLGRVPLRAASTRDAVIGEAIAHGGGMLGVLVYLSVVVFSCLRLCRKFDVPVGGIVFDISNMVTKYPYLAVPLTTALVAADCRILAFLRRNGRSEWLATSWSVLITALLVASTAVMLWALVRLPFGVVRRGGMQVDYPF